MLVAIGLLTMAMAEEPPTKRPLEISAGLQAGFGFGESVGSGGPSQDVRVGLPLSQRWLLEASSASPFDVNIDMRLGARYFIDEPWSARPALSVTAYPLGYSRSPWGYAAAAGLAYDVPISDRLVSRFSLEAAYSGSQTGLLATLSVVMPPRRVEPVVRTVYIEREVPVEVVEEVEETQVVWIPEPVCDWMPVDEADALLASIQDPVMTNDVTGEENTTDVASTETTENAEQDAEQGAEQGAEQDAEQTNVMTALASAAESSPLWAPESAEGTLIVIAHPGDTILIGDEALESDAQGITQLQREEGIVEFEIISGGQRQFLRAGIVPGYTVWVRAGDPQPDAVFFALNSSTLDAASSRHLQEVAENASGWSFVLQGGYSPEGSLDHNRALAVERARAVSRVLQENGITQDQIIFLDPPKPDPNSTPQEQRMCRLIPVAPRGGSEGGL